MLSIPPSLCCRVSVIGDPVPTLLHISDLHRTSTPRIDNDELLSAILSDTKRWEEEGIPSPEVIVVSGDLIQGTNVNHPNPDSEIARQYAEVGAFLQQLTNEVVDSDPSRVIIVPGNHDVHWSRALQAMSPLETSPDTISVKAFEVNSTIRWNWKESRKPMRSLTGMRMNLALSTLGYFKQTFMPA